MASDNRLSTTGEQRKKTVTLSEAHGFLTENFGMMIGGLLPVMPIKRLIHTRYVTLLGSGSDLAKAEVLKRLAF